MLRIINSSETKAVRALLQARQSSLEESLSKARRILEDVRREGDRALIRYTRRFDGLDLRKTGFTVSRDEIRRAARVVPKAVAWALRVAARNIRAAARRQLPRAWLATNDGGVEIGQLVRPLERVVCYVPGGRFPLPSTVLMSVIPAQVAGVPEVLITSPRPARLTSGSVDSRRSFSAPRPARDSASPASAGEP